MNKEELPDFYSIYAGDTEFNDASFSHENEDVLVWANQDETNRWANHGITWKRIKDIYSDHTLFGKNLRDGINPISATNSWNEHSYMLVD